MSAPRTNRIMGYVIQACNDLDLELQEVWCGGMKCVYRFVDETEDQAHWFLYGTSADYESVRGAVQESVQTSRGPSDKE